MHVFPVLDIAAATPTMPKAAADPMKKALSPPLAGVRRKNLLATLPTGTFLGDGLEPKQPYVSRHFVAGEHACDG